MEKRKLCFYRDDVNDLNVDCFIVNNDMYFDINHLNRILFDLQVHFHYMYNKYHITYKNNNKYIKYDLKKRYISKENLLVLFPIFVEEYIFFEGYNDKLKDLMSFYSHLKNRRNYDLN